MSQELKRILCTILEMLELVAQKTANPIDDIVIKGLQAMLGCNTQPRPNKKILPDTDKK